MSLLMDALKKAEAAKRQTGQAEHAPLSEPSAAQPAEPGAALPELPRELSILDDQFTIPHGAVSASGREAADPPISETQRDREAAHNLFTVKHSPSRAPFWIGLTATTLTAVAAIGYWFWWQVQPPAGALKPGPALAQQSAGVPPVQQPPPISETKPATAPPPETTSLPQATPSSRVSQRQTAQIKTERPSVQPRTAAMARSAEPRSAESRLAGRYAVQPPSDAETPGEPRVRRAAAPREQISPAVARGYSAYVAGDLASAKRNYEDALRTDPHSLDALNGMAAIALRAGRRDLAETYLTQSLEADPRDGYALSALATLKAQSDPRSAESRLKGLISASPDSPAAHFGLGNLYARDGRWAEAQQAYFRAFSSEPDNPDYLFNLAVSLDHLRQSKLALQYYQSALATSRPGAFDRQQVGARIRDLQQYQ